MKLSLCTVAAVVAASVHAVAANCDVSAKAGLGKFTVEAHAFGPDCGKTIVVIALRDGAGNPLWVDARKSADVMLFIDAKNLQPSGMQQELKTWITREKNQTRTSMLPEWPATATDNALPAKAEFQFHVADGLDRESYQKLRTQNLEMLCYVSGIESQRCIAVLPGGEMTELGYQSFPG